MQNKWLELPLLGFMIVSSMYTIHVRMRLKKADGKALTHPMAGQLTPPFGEWRSLWPTD